MSESEAVLESHLAEQFDDVVQQKEAGLFGMWVFLATEVLFFGGLFGSYAIYRHMYPDVFAEGSKTLSISLGTINTAVLICSSLTMAMAVHSAATSKRKLLMFFLVLTLILGFAFLGIKAVEYYAKYRDHHIPGHGFVLGPELANLDPHSAQMYFVLYFAMTGLHATHMIIGAGLLTFLLIMSYRGKYNSAYYTPVEVSGLYWHFVDIVWIFLYPLLYLIDLHKG